MGAGNYSPADAATDLHKHEALKRWVTLWSLVPAASVSLGALAWSALASLSLLLGALCGVLNMQLVMYGTQRLIKRRSVGAFVISSFLRLGAFAIVPLGLALTGKWWTLAVYFAGFFLPLALYLFSVRRHFERK
ncbi:MAG: hypothetical protein JO024_07565 [Candidatus Eremiobacteraeota bacterium]|nr:hypothetical protein [Candidatus Eremiobacteraeota bacterium]